MESKKCYFCQAYATSREHVPPKCLFPEKKDILGFDLRRDLITVPSCEIHNTAKSSDDEFLLLNLSGIVGSNTVGEIQRWKKVERARIRRKWNIPDIVLDRTDNIEEVSNDGELQVLASWGPPDLPRLNSCYESIARGIHLHHYGNYFDGEINTHICYLTRQSGNFKPDHERFGHAIERDMKGKTFHGSNPMVFCYQLSDKDQIGLYGVRLRFYENLDVYCGYVRKGIVIPDHPINKLIATGEPFIWEEGGHQYLYNHDKE